MLSGCGLKACLPFAASRRVTSLQTLLVLKNKQELDGCVSWRNVCVLVPLPVNPLHSSGPWSLLNTQAKWSWNCLSNHNYPSLFSFQVSSWRHLVLWRGWSSKAFWGQVLAGAVVWQDIIALYCKVWHEVHKEDSESTPSHLLPGPSGELALSVTGPCRVPMLCVEVMCHLSGISSTDLMSSTPSVVDFSMCFQFLHSGDPENSVLDFKL